jgi:hypothetical protein
MVEEKKTLLWVEREVFRLNQSFKKLMREWERQHYRQQAKKAKENKQWVR